MQTQIQMQTLVPLLDKDQWNTEEVAAAVVVLVVLKVVEDLLELHFRLQLHLHCLHHFLECPPMGIWYHRLHRLFSSLM